MLANLKRKKVICLTPLEVARKAFILALKDSGEALVLRLSKKLGYHGQHIIGEPGRFRQLITDRFSDYIHRDQKVTHYVMHLLKKRILA